MNLGVIYLLDVVLLYLLCKILLDFEKKLLVNIEIYFYIHSEPLGKHGTFKNS